MNFQDLPSNWRITTLANIAKPQYGLVDGPFGSSLPAAAYTDSGIPVIRGSNLSVGLERFKADEFVFVSEETAKRLSRSLCQADDIIFTKKGTLGQTGIVPRHESYKQFLVSSNQMKLSVDEELADPLYVYYWVSSPDSVAKILRDAEATGVPKTNLQYLRTFPIALPRLPEQRAIASILGALDDKIELNRRMNATLEAMARAIFQSWFVDFDPVLVKAEGREPGLSAEIAGLFPDGFTESGNVRRPATWYLGQLSDLLVLQRGFDLPSSSRVEGPYPVMAASGPSGTHNEFAVKGPGVTTGRSGVLGKVFLVQDDFWPLNTSLWVKEFRISQPYHAYFLLKTLDFATYNAGSAVPTLNRNHVHNLPLALPPVELVERFEVHVEPLFHQIENNERQISTLSNVRDTLLPKLMSGELRLSEAEELVEEATA